MSWYSAILLYFIVSAVVELLVMAKSPRVYRSIMDNEPIETGVLFVGVALTWPLILAAVMLGFLFWGVGKGLGKIFRRKGRR